MNTKNILILAAVAIGGYWLYKKRKMSMAAATVAPTVYAQSLAAKYEVPVEVVMRLIESIPEAGIFGPPPEVVAEKILSQK